MSYDKLKAQLKAKSLSNLLHFFGDEDYLKAYYLDKCTELAVTDFPEFNITVFEDSVNANDLEVTLETPPVMSEKRLVILKNTGIFTASSAQKNLFAEIFKNVPEYAIIILCEDNFDRRSAVYSAFTSSGGMSVDFAYRTPADIRAWVSKILASLKIQIETPALLYFLDAAGVSMNAVRTQLDKLCALCAETKLITMREVEAVISKSPAAREYNLSDALLERNPRAAFDALMELEMMKSEPIKLLYMLSSNFVTAYRAKLLLSEGMTESAAAAALKLPHPFLAKKAVRAATRCSVDYLQNAIDTLCTADRKMKLGESAPMTILKLACSHIVENTKFS